MNDGWSEHGEDDDSSIPYPAAPLPPHERIWRHPSELGPIRLHAANPIGLGRGLVAAAGLVGVAAVVGMVWLMSPSEPPVQVGAATSANGGTSAPSQTTSTLRATTTVSRAVASVEPSTTEPAPFETSVGSDTSAPSAPSTSSPQRSATTAAPPEPAAQLAPLATVSITATGQHALLWSNGKYAITASDGLAVDSMTDIRFADGAVQRAAVISVTDGIAVIAIATPQSAAELPMDDMPAPGTPVAIESAQGIEVTTLVADPEGTPIVRPASPAPTGCAVRNAAGSLIGITLPVANGSARVVSVARIDELVHAAEQVGGWLGIVVATDRGAAGDGATVGSVIAGSPAETAGLLPGDRIVSIDGSAVTSFDQVAALLRTFRPGRSIAMTFIRAEEQFDIVVALGTRPTGTMSSTGTTSSPQATTVPVATLAAVSPTTTVGPVDPDSAGSTTIPHGTTAEDHDSDHGPSAERDHSTE